MCNRVYCIHVPGHYPLIFSFLSFILFDWVGVLWPQLSKVLKPVRWDGQRPFPPSVPAEAGCLFAVAAGVHLRGEPVSSYFSMACYSVVYY